MRSWGRFWVSTLWLLVKVACIVLLMHGARGTFVYQNF
jgi:hypothetical protein